MRARDRASDGSDVAEEYAELAPDYDTRWAGYVARTAELTLEGLGLGAGECLVDVGCGTGVLLARALEIEPRLDLIGVDPSREMLEMARARLPPGVPLLDAPAEALPLGDARADVMVSSSSLHYWSDPASGLRELARVLRPGGRLVISDWDGDAWRTRATVLWLRILRRPLGRVMGERELRALLASSGFGEIEASRHAAGGWRILRISARRD